MDMNIDRIINWTVIILLSLLGIIMIIPFIWILLLAFKSNAEIMSESTIFPRVWRLDGYRSMLERGNMVLYWYKNSLTVTISIIVLTILTSAIGGYVFGKFDFRGKNLLFIGILASMMVPFQVTMIPIFLLMKEFNLLNSLWALILPGIISPFGIFLCRQFIEVVPSEMLEAARIDGSGEFQIFFRIVFPQIIPIVSALTIFMFIQHWNDYLWPLIVINEQTKMTLSLGLQYFGTKYSKDYSGTMFMTLIIMAPVILLFLAFQRHFIRGITLTGMK